MARPIPALPPVTSTVALFRFIEGGIVARRPGKATRNRSSPAPPLQAVRFEIPRVLATNLATVNNLGSEGDEAIDTKNRSRTAPKVLIVDDEATVRESLGRLVTLEGFLAETVSGVVEALEILQTSRFQAIVLDIRMPDSSGQDRSGIDVLSFMRARQHLASIPVLVLTGVTLTEAEEKAILGLKAYVVNKSEGYETVLRYLKHLTSSPRPSKRDTPPFQ